MSGSGGYGEGVTCYARHLRHLLPETPTEEDRRALDAAIRRVLRIGPGAACPEVWAAVKATDRARFDERVRAEL